MKLFQGLERTDYQDVLRALGFFLDEQGYSNIRIIEHEEGLIVQGTPRVDGHVVHTYKTVLLTDEDIEHLIRHAYSRRVNGRMPAEPMPTGRPLLTRGQRTRSPL